MNADVIWLARLGIDHGLFTQAACRKLIVALGVNVEMMDFAQELVDNGTVTDHEALEKLLGLALTKAKLGPPLSNPFEDDDEDDGFVPPPLPGGAKPKAKAPAVPLPSFPWDKLAAMDEKTAGTGLRDLLRACVDYGASDLHLTTGARPFIRKSRGLSFLAERPLTADDAMKLNTALLTPIQKTQYAEKRDLDLALALDKGDRYRVNLMVHKQGSAGSYRMVPAEAKSMTELGFAAHLETLKKLLSYHNGLILITGPVGSGKTTTLASMVAYINETREDHIITVEDPIEVVQASKGCNVTQREVGNHTKNFHSALKGALREDPDVIIIGELRDLETIEMAITAAETGHLVIGTMHTSDAATTLNRLLDVFPAAQQTQIRASVAESLRGIVCQRLLPGIEGGVAFACEIMITNTAISNLIREGKTTGLRNTMETGVREGMCLMDNVVFQLWNDRQISNQIALLNIGNRVLKAKIT